MDPKVVEVGEGKRLQELDRIESGCGVARVIRAAEWGEAERAEVREVPQRGCDSHEVECRVSFEDATPELEDE